MRTGEIVERIPNPVKLGFNPKNAEEAVRTIFEDQTARTLWLAWRVNHIVSQYFIFDCWESAKRIKSLAPPLNEAELKRCLVGYSFMVDDVKRWTSDAVKYFNGEELNYVVSALPTLEH
jgi:hypothetical protein